VLMGRFRHTGMLRQKKGISAYRFGQIVSVIIMHGVLMKSRKTGVKQSVNIYCYKTFLS
jgi:hypothetical protein